MRTLSANAWSMPCPVTRMKPARCRPSSTAAATLSAGAPPSCQCEMSTVAITRMLSCCSSHKCSSPDVFIPEFRVGGDELSHHCHAPLVVKDHYRHAVFGQPVVPSGERPTLPDHHRPDVELTHQPAAVPAGRQRRHHHCGPVVALPAGGPKRIGLSVHRRVILLDPPV